jgi:hypothetical protein
MPVKTISLNQQGQGVLVCDQCGKTKVAHLADVPHLGKPLKIKCRCGHSFVAQFIGLCSSLKWSRHLTNSPFLALPATVGSNAAYKIISACSHAVS